MRNQRIPEMDSIEELAAFWDTHDLTDFEDQLEEVAEPNFVRGNRTIVEISLNPMRFKHSDVLRGRQALKKPLCSGNG